MCGIAGTVGGTDAAIDIAPQLAVLRHRGPDAEGAYAGGGAAIGQNRLSIIDVAGGDPPIANEDGTVGVVLNGEIYNFRELREQLTGRGHRFATRCDTEVIAHLAEDEDDPLALVRRLDGMFALAVWDRRRDRLILARDRAGKKPLYWWHDGARLVFASEIKGLLADPAVPRRLASDVLPAYLTFGYVPEPRTFFEGIHSLPPAHVLVLERGAAPRVERYWTPPAVADGPAPTAGDVRGLLRDAVERRLVSDVPLGAFLSGGLDSSIIVALMSELVDEPVRTFTIGFEDERFDERPYARIVAQRYRTEHHEERVEPDKVDLVERLVWHHDQPFGDSSAIPTYLLCEVTRRGVTVALSGDGGDELFAGYERFPAALAVARAQALPLPLRRLAARAAARLPARLAPGRAESVRRLLACCARPPQHALREWAGFVGDGERAALTGAPPNDWAIESYDRDWAASAGAPTLERLLNLNFRTYLPGDLLVKTDRMSMAHGLEVRCPFLDTTLVERAAALRPQQLLRGLSTKRILREAFADLPPEVLGRRKRGFGVPVDRWFRGDLRDYLVDRLGPRSRVREHLDGAGVARMVEDHLSGRENLGHALWTLLTLEVFLRAQGW